MNRLTFLLFFTAIVFISCKTNSEYITIDGYTFKEFLAPGVNKVSKNFYADEREVSNIDYKEYIYWITDIYGVNSVEFKEILPDFNVWNFQSNYDSLNIKYFMNPEFNNHPLVGISLKQANLYSLWRSERVAEMILINEKLIKKNTNKTRENYFTVERYLEGTYEFTIKNKASLILPKYTIPTIEEWETISGINSDFKLGLDSLDKLNKKLIKSEFYLFNTKELFSQRIKNLNQSSQNEIEYTPTIPTHIGYRNIHGLRNIIGNVSELVSESGINKGGDWFHFFNDLDLKKTSKVNIPNCWTGFRTVCRFEIRRKERKTETNN